MTPLGSAASKGLLTDIQLAAKFIQYGGRPYLIPKSYTLYPAARAALKPIMHLFKEGNLGMEPKLVRQATISSAFCKSDRHHHDAHTVLHQERFETSHGHGVLSLPPISHLGTESSSQLSQHCVSACLVILMIIFFVSMKLFWRFFWKRLRLNHRGEKHQKGPCASHGSRKKLVSTPSPSSTVFPSRSSKRTQLASKEMAKVRPSSTQPKAKALQPSLILYSSPQPQEGRQRRVNSRLVNPGPADMVSSYVNHQLNMPNL